MIPTEPEILFSLLVMLAISIIISLVLHRQALRFVFDSERREEMLESWRRRRRKG